MFLIRHRRLATELHDDVAHDLAVIVMRLESLRLTGRPLEVPELDPVLGSARDALGGLRQQIQRLRLAEQGQLDEQQPEAPGLDEALDRAQRRLADRGFTVRTQMEGDVDVPSAVRPLVARVLIEGANNIVRHGESAEPCSYLISGRESSIELMLRNAVREGAAPGGGTGAGLATMQEQVQAVGGQIVAGPRGNHWVLHVVLPLSRFR